MTPAACAPAAPPQDEVEAAARLLAHDPAQAERRACALLRRRPGDPRAALILASARRRRGDGEGARQLLEPLARAFPGAANTHYELGLARQQGGDPTGAIAALRRATALDRDLALAWKALGELLFEAGDLAGAQAAFAGRLRATLADPGLKLAADALAAGDLVGAEARVHRRLAVAPRDVSALSLLGEVLARQGRPDAAEAPLRQALALDGGDDGARFNLATALFQGSRAADALPLVRALLERAPDEPAYLNLLAACLGHLGALDEVAAINARLVARFPGQPQVWLNLGHALRVVGPAAEAAAAYRRCIALAPGLGDAYWSLANLKLERLVPGEVAAVRRALARADTGDTDRLHLAYALGKALEDAGDWAGSFASYAEGARVRRAQAPYSAAANRAQGRAIVARYDAGFLAERRGGGDPSPRPIFIVGLPRSGSTLVEQILASHPEVEGAMELADVGLIARSLAARSAGRSAGELGAAREVDHLAAVSALDAAERTALGRAYLDATEVHRSLGRPRLIDKMPNNFRHVGLIELMLPNACIVDVRRHPMAAGFAAFKQHFAQGQHFSYDLADIGAYYRDYVELMDHFDRALPGRVHRVIYEDLVEDTQGEVRRLLAACGLPYDPACLEFHRNARPVRTVSSEQVRRPIFRDGLDRWRRYEPWLSPLREALGPALDGWRGRAAR